LGNISLTVLALYSCNNWKKFIFDITFNAPLPSPHLTSHILTSPYLTSPSLTSSHLTSPNLT
jgi:hypothetical protein